MAPGNIGQGLVLPFRMIGRIIAVSMWVVMLSSARHQSIDAQTLLLDVDAIELRVDVESFSDYGGGDIVMEPPSLFASSPPHDFVHRAVVGNYEDQLHLDYEKNRRAGRISKP